MSRDFEFYETPRTFTRYLFREMHALGHSICGTVFEPCVGSGAIVTAVEEMRGTELRAPWVVDHWLTNDLDTRWKKADWHLDALSSEPWRRASHYFPPDRGFDWTVSNPFFTGAIDIISAGLEYSRVGVAMHLRASIHEVLKTGVRRTFLAQHTPTGILWLPRFAYQRSKKTGEWATDSVCACWVIWLKAGSPQFIRYAPEWVLDELQAETPAYRTRMDALMADRLVIA